MLVIVLWGGVGHADIVAPRDGREVSVVREPKAHGPRAFFNTFLLPFPATLPATLRRRAAKEQQSRALWIV